MCELYMQSLFGANTVFGANAFPPQIYQGFLLQKMCELFPHIYIEGFLFALAIFTANLHEVCQPQCDANSW